MESNHSTNRTSAHLFNALWMGSEPALTMQAEHPLFIALLIVMDLQILIGNLLLLHTVFSGRLFGNKFTTSHVILSLASADLLIGLLILPYYVICVQMLGLRDPFSWHYRLWSVLDSSLTTASIYSLALVTLDRLLAIRYPLHYTRTVTRKHLHLAIGCIWLLAVGCSFAGQLLVGRQRWLQLLGTVITFYLPFIFIFVSNCFTFIFIRKRMRSTVLRVKPICSVITPPLVPVLRNGWHLADNARSSSSTICSQASTSTYVQASRRCSLCTCASARLPESICTCSQLSVPEPPKRPAWLQAITKPKVYRMPTPLSAASPTMSLPLPLPSMKRTPPTPLSSSSQQIGMQLTRNYNLVFREFKLLKLLGTINLCFIICWLPYYLNSELIRFDVIPFDRQLTVYFLTLGWYNSGLDPLIYLYLSKQLRKKMKKTFCCFS